MNDDSYKDMVLQHDKHIDSLASSIGTLADNVGSTNKKLDDVIDIINHQNVLVERMNNIDTNVKEFAVRIGTRLDSIEKQQNHEGCSALKLEHENINSLGKSVDQLRLAQTKIESKVEDYVKTNDVKTSKFLNGNTIKGVVLFIVGYLIVFGTYVVQELHRLDKVAYKPTTTQSIESRITNLEKGN